MPKISNIRQQELLERGVERIGEFCTVNAVPIPLVSVVLKGDWPFDVCAYYRPKDGIRVCLALCAHPATEAEVRNWNWPGNTTDREPYGVVCHELGHHVDVFASEKKGSYYGNYSHDLHRGSGEPPITSYCPNQAEWFAEMFRVFVTNQALLRWLRPKTWGLLTDRWIPVGSDDWVEELGMGVPDRILRNLRKKGAP